MTKRARHIHTSRGFTLIEAILYLALFVALSTFLIDALLVMSKAYTEVRVNRDLLESAQVSMERMTREIRSSSGASSSDGSALTLNTTDEHGVATSVHFDLSDGAIHMGNADAGAGIGTLSNSHVQVESLVFRIIHTTSSEAVRIEMTLKSLRSATGKTISLTDTAVLRGSY